MPVRSPHVGRTGPAGSHRQQGARRFLTRPSPRGEAAVPSRQPPLFCVEWGARSAAQHIFGGLQIGAANPDRDQIQILRTTTTAINDPAATAQGVRFYRVIQDREKAEELLKLIEEDEDIAVLVLAAAAGKEGPGPMVANLAKSAGEFPIVVGIVPGHLSDADLDTMS